MRARLQNYYWLIKSLGFLGFLFYKLQLLSVQLLRIQHPVPLISKRAKFPLLFRPNSSDHAVFFQVFVNQGYRCLDKVHNPELIIDCGANVGYTSAYLLSRFPTARVIAVEPDPENFAMLEMNLARYTGRYRTIRSAVWSHATRLVLAGTEPGSEWSRSVKEASTTESSRFVATDINTLLEESGFPRISILKIDIEGAEIDVFASNYQKWIPKVDNLVIELHGEECAAVFEKAIAEEKFVRSRCGELMVCTRPKTSAS
jgi:FkbM family methyltransferase